MTIKSKRVLIALFALTGIASPGYAQSTDRTGSPLPYHYDSTGAQILGTWDPQFPTLVDRQVVRSGPRPKKNAGYGVRLFNKIPDAAGGFNSATSGYDPGIETQR